MSGSSDATVTVWEGVDQARPRVLRANRPWVSAVAWSRTTHRIASGSADHTVRLWDAVTGVCTHILQGHTDRVCSVDWSPDGSMLASGSYDGSVRLWEPQARASRGESARERGGNAVGGSPH